MWNIQAEFVENIFDNTFAIDHPGITQYEIDKLKQRINETVKSEEHEFDDLADAFLFVLDHIHADISLNQEMIDEWATKSLKRSIALRNAIKIHSFAESKLLAHAIKNNLRNFAILMISYEFGVNEQTDDESLPMFLLKKQDFDLLEKMEEFIKITDLFQDKSAMHLLKHANSAFYQRLLNKIKPDEFSWSENIKLPINQMTKQVRDAIREKISKAINEMPLFMDNLSLRETFINFMDNQTPLKFNNMDRLSIAYQTVQFLLHPELIDQRSTFLCGSVVLMQYLALESKEMFIYQTLEMAELQNMQERKFLPKKIKDYPSNAQQEFYSLDDMWLQTLRHNYSLIGYNSQSRLQKLMGVTTPYMLENMFRDFGMEIIAENFQIQFTNTLRVGRLFDNARAKLANLASMPEPFKFYGLNHKEISNDDKRFEALCEWYKDNPNKTSTIVVSSEFINEYISNHAQPSQMFYLLDGSHYLNITKFDYKQDDSLSLTLYSWGKEFDIKTTGKKFKSIYAGGLFVNPNITYKDKLILTPKM